MTKGIILETGWHYVAERKPDGTVVTITDPSDPRKMAIAFGTASIEDPTGERNAWMHLLAKRGTPDFWIIQPEGAELDSERKGC